MAYDPTGRLLLTPEDPDAPARTRRLRELGVAVGDEPVPAWDAVARRLAHATGAARAMVTLVGEHRQFFAGLHVSEGPRGPRSMARDRGFCPYAIVRRKALVLDDVADYPRFAGNPVVDEAGVRSYCGAPLLEASGTALAAVAVADLVPRAWGRHGVAAVKAAAAELTGLLLAGRAPWQPPHPPEV
ncbi:GAF domain-containing protein [Streptomyces sp. SBT349]|uniref:GAF domain-containing protein n=1 Tax=Streptomyces sp. SBT349 TaxID=1580539 RepID=UPI00066B5D12|nr:GAF domain-containing protein [Streptomyces sp. SBT349]